MPHSDGRIYSETRNGVKYGVDLLNDVCPVLGLGNRTVAQVCMNIDGKINKWAKFKPENVGGMSPLSLDLRKNNNFGLSAGAVYTSKLEFINAVKGGTFKPGWIYTPPSASAFKRIGDFDGYDHKSLCPFGVLLSFTGTLSTNTQTSLLIPCQSPPQSEDYINVADMQMADYDFKNWYFGILLYHASRQFMATAQATIGSNGDWQVNFGWINPSYAATYKGVPFLSSRPFTVSGAEPSGVKIVGLENSGVDIVLRTTSALYVPFVTCMYVDPVNNMVSYTASIQNTGGSSVTLTQVGIQVAESYSGSGAISFVSFGSVTIAAGQTWVKTGTAAIPYNGNAEDKYQFCKLAYNGGGTNWISFELAPSVDPDVGQ